MTMAVNQAPRFSSIAVATDRSKAFRQAVRHSAMVRVLRMLFPALAVAVGALYFIPTGFKAEIAGNEVAIDAVSVSTGDLKMTNPRIKGQNKTQGKYDVRAVSAIQTVADPDTLNLDTIDAEVINASGETTTLKAPGGVYKTKLEEMVFNRGVVVERTSGLTARLKSASAFFAKNLVTSREPVEVLLRQSVIRANGLELFTDKSRAMFSGNVSVHLVREQPAEAAQPVTSPAAAYQLDPQKPIDITSDTLEVDDLSKTATFRGAVSATQGEFNIKSNELKVGYEGSGLAQAPPQTGQPGAQADVKSIEARGAVVITSKDGQTARGEYAIYDAATQTMTLTENVVVAQEQNSVQSDSVVINTATSRSYFQMNPQRRLKAVFTPKGADGAKVAKPETPKTGAALQPSLINPADAKKPIYVEARSLEVDDKKQLATFRENVSATQGDFNIKSQALEVAYAQPGPGPKTANAGGAPAGDVRNIVARGKVLVTSKEQNASSDKAVFDVKAQTVTLTENVVVTQGKNIIKGDRLVIDVTTGKSTFQMNDSGRTSAVFEAKSPQNAGEKERTTPKTGKEQRP
jgi:lipopolysaccharide transport protein LptA